MGKSCRPQLCSSEKLILELSQFIDRERGLCGLYASQVMPIGDPRSNELLHAFEKAIYERYDAFERERSS